MKSFSQRPLTVLFALFLYANLFPLDIAAARPRGGGGFRRGGASPRINSSVNLQNRGNISFPTENRSQFQQNRQINPQNRQEGFTERTEIRQGERTERTEIRQDAITDRQRNRQDFIDDNYYGGRWFGGGWYGRGYHVPPGWGWVGFTTGLIIGSTISTLPPYYNTVYVGSTTYIYSDGVFLQPSGSSYVVIKPPVGVVVSYLPEGCTTTQINNILYYNCSNIYYQPFYQNGSTVYKVVQL